MTINIIRGQNQIGGSIIEISSESTRIILDAGAELEEKSPKAPDVNGLFSGQAAYDAASVSHYHGDHIGLCDQLLNDIPIYIGERAGAVTNTARAYMGKPSYRFSGYYETGIPFIVGDMVITPYLCDHSAFDAYMFQVSCNGKTLLYTGDFRSHGRKSFKGLLRRLPAGIDLLLIEGTTLSRDPTKLVSESDLEKKAVQLIARTSGPVFVLLAGTNIDRVVTIYRAARKSKRILLQDLYLAAVTTAAGEKIPNPKDFEDVKVFLTNNADNRYEQLQSYGEAKIGRQSIAQSKFVMCIRPSMKKYLEKLSELRPFENGLVLYSLWEGYKQKDEMAEFIEFMHKKGCRVVSLHTSGHADAGTIDALIRKVQPKSIMPVHTIHSDWFDRYQDLRIVKDQAVTL